MAITVQMRTEVSQLYVAIFGRAPDGEGLGYWVQQLNAGQSLIDVANTMYATAPARAYYPLFQTNAEIVHSFYANVFGVTNDAEGEAFWTAKLNAGQSFGSVVTQVIAAALANTNPSGAVAKATLENKIAVAQWYGENNGNIEGATSVLSGVTDDAASVEAAKAGGAQSGQTFMLTKGLDNYQGTAGNDTIIGSIHGSDAELKTLSTLDVVNGGAGVDTLKIATDGTAVGLPNMTNVEIVEVESAGAATVDTSAVAGVTNLNVLKAATAVSAKAAATTDINVSLKQGTAVGNTAPTADVKADIAVTGGKNVTVNVTDVKQVLDPDAGAAELNGIVVGGAGAAAAAGTVTVTSTGAATAANADATLSSITVTGGTTISVTQKATSDASAAAADTTGTTITQGAVTVAGNASTTTVTVKQDASVAEVLAVPAVAAKASTQDVSFAAMTAGQTVIVDFGDGRLTFTANKDLTAAEAASAFANLAANAKQGNASAALGIYTDTTDATATGVTNGWTSGAVTTVSATEAKVTFTSATAATAILNGGGGVAVTPGAYSGNAVAAVAAKAGVLGVANSVVLVDDHTTAGLKTITIDGYANTSRIGTTNDTTVLETLNLSNSGLTFTSGKVTAAAGITVDDTAATLALNLEKVGFSGYYNGDATTTTQAAAVTLTAAPTTLNVKSTGSNYVNLTAAATETLNVSGTGLLDISAAALAGVKTVKVTETAGLKLNGGETTITSVDTTGTTGTVTASIVGGAATYAGGAGVDNLTVQAGGITTQAINLGAGNDRLNLTALTKAQLEGITVTNVLEGGADTDTVVLSAANADITTGVSGTNTFAARINGFEKLEVGNPGSTATTVDLSKIDAINYVISTGSLAATAPALPTVVETTKGSSTGPVNEVQTVTFGALLAGQSVTVAGRILTATADATAAQVAAAFGSGTTAGGVTVGGTLAATWTAAAASGSSVAITAAGVAAGTDVAIVVPTTAAGAAPATLTLDKMLTDATVEMKAAGSVEVKLGTDGTADVVNFVANAATNTVLGTATADKVETINIEAKDTDVTTAVAASGAVTANVSTNTLVLDADAAKTVNLTGAGNLTLTLSTDSKEVTLIDGSTATGKLTVTTLAVDTAATTVKGGSAADTLTAGGTNDVLMGGDGKDTLKLGTAAVFSKLDGGAGIDTYVVKDVVMSQIGDYSQIVNLEKGETIQFKSGANANFLATKFVLGGAVGFDSYATQALAKAVEFADANDGGGNGSGGMAWFQFTNNLGATNTYVVQDNNGTAGFQSGDIVIEIVGAVDLSASSFNEVGQGTLLYI